MSPIPLNLGMQEMEDSTIKVVDSTFLFSRSYIFPVNEYKIPLKAPIRKDIETDLMPVLQQDSFRLESIKIHSAASPEGPVLWNKKLAKLRGKSLLDLLTSHAPDSLENKLSVTEITEDYDYLLELMEERGDEDYERVKALVVQWKDSGEGLLGKALRREDGGKLWRRLLREYYPQMRSAKVEVVSRRYREVIVPTPEPTPPPEDTDSTIHDPDLAMPDPSALPVPPVEPPMEKLPRREFMSVKSNLLYDFAYMPAGYNRFCPIPNVALEFYPLHGHFTYGFSFDCPWWQDYNDHKYFQVRNYQVESRYYFRTGDVNVRGIGNGAAFQGFYAQAYAHLGLYAISFTAHRAWVGEGGGGGLGAGYVLPIGKSQRWRLEFAAQLGLFITKYDPFQYECPVDPTENDNLYYYKWKGDASLFKKRQHRFTWFGPTRIGISISYDLLYRKRSSKGVSLRHREYGPASLSRE